jgi:hypothetical protein
VAKKRKQRKKTRNADPVQYQIGIRFRKLPGLRVTRQLIDQVVREFCLTGNQSFARDTIQVVVVRWKNPYRRDMDLATWKEATTPATIAHAHQTLHLRRLLQLRPGVFRGVRSR